MFLSALLVFITAGLTFYHCFIHYGRVGKLVNKIPGPTVLPLLGNVWEFLVPLSKILKQIILELQFIEEYWYDNL